MNPVLVIEYVAVVFHELVLDAAEHAPLLRLHHPVFRLVIRNLPDFPAPLLLVCCLCLCRLRGHERCGCDDGGRCRDDMLLADAHDDSPLRLQYIAGQKTISVFTQFIKFYIRLLTLVPSRLCSHCTRRQKQKLALKKRCLQTAEFFIFR